MLFFKKKKTSSHEKFISVSIKFLYLSISTPNLMLLLYQIIRRLSLTFSTLKLTICLILKMCTKIVKFNKLFSKNFYW